MIDIDLDRRAISLFVDDIVDDILLPRINRALGNKFGKLLPFEVTFYKKLKNVARTLVRHKPNALETRFNKWLRRHEAYMVYASGSWKKFKRHVQVAGPSVYDLEWSKHQPKNRNCTCLFCEVSARAASVFCWTDFLNGVKKKPAMAPLFVRAVGFVVCPYCSRNHISPISDTTGDIYRPDLDHFFARSLYPYFGLSLYNLIPSCAACNLRIKGSEDFLNNGYFHPYVDKVPDQLFSMEGDVIVTSEKIDGDSIKIHINTTKCAKTEKSAKFFRLPEAYAVHASEVANFVASLDHYPDELIEERAQQLRADPNILKLMLSRSGDADKTEYKRRPLGKLYRDLYLLKKRRLAGALP